ncbi:MAG: hypothetical protein DWP94_03825 [Flavobacterium sp.]|nr:MAG: hypothetical protein DWP94_03825 [Flavobacterium sp.]
MITTVWIPVFMLIVWALLWILFNLSNRRLTKEFSIRTVEVERELMLNKLQIRRRSKHLDRYDFLRYNLDEAIFVQREIIV